MNGSRINGLVGIGCLVLVSLLASATTGQTPALDDSAPRGVDPSPAAIRQYSGSDSVVASGAEGMLAVASPNGAGGQMVTLVDTRKNCMAVYAVDAKGQIKLLSSRPISQDLSVQYNVTEPTPAAISRLTNR